MALTLFEMYSNPKYCYYEVTARLREYTKVGGKLSCADEPHASLITWYNKFELKIMAGARQQT